MPSPQLMRQGFNIVLIGNFNPVIFQPQWVAAHGLLRQQEADAAEVKVIHPDVVIFQAEWVKFHVTRDRFLAGTMQEAFFNSLADLVIGTFQILQHTPIRMLGINSDFHFRFDSEETWNEFGDRIAPKEMWRTLMGKPGLLSLEIKGAREHSTAPGYVRVQVQPSAEYHPGASINVNDHYELPGSPDKPIGCSEIIKILMEESRASREAAKNMTQRILMTPGEAR